MHAPRSTSIIEPELLMLAYRSGIFPMSDDRDDPEIFWIEPRLRAILPLDGLKVSGSLARTLKRGRFTVTRNRAFPQVMDACAAPRRTAAEDVGDPDRDGSWISHRIQASYENLHALGHAHSIEVWQEGQLVGGLYGVGFDRVFCGESMFSRVSDSSKVALCWLVAALRIAGVILLDCQFMTSHLASLGAVELPQKRYLAMLQSAQSTQPAQRYVAGSSAGSGVAVADGAADGVGEGAGAGVLALPDAFDVLLADAASSGLASSPGKFIAQLFTQTS